VNPRIAHFLSAILHPLLMPTLLFGILLFAAPEIFQNLQNLSESSRIDAFGVQFSLVWGLLLLILNLTFLIPAYLIYVMYKFGAIQSLKMETLADRQKPFALVTLVYTLATLFFYFKMRQLPELSLAAVTIISTSWQISAHGTGIGGMLGAVMALLVQTGAEGLYYPMLGILITAGFLMSARLQLNAHTPKQIIAGLSLGFGISMAAVLFWF
jgi:hypothetical protein